MLASLFTMDNHAPPSEVTGDCAGFIATACTGNNKNISLGKSLGRKIDFSFALLSCAIHHDITKGKYHGALLPGHTFPRYFLVCPSEQEHKYHLLHTWHKDILQSQGILKGPPTNSSSPILPTPGIMLTKKGIHFPGRKQEGVNATPREHFIGCTSTLVSQGMQTHRMET